LVISGQAYFVHEGANPAYYLLIPKVDGATVASDDFSGFSAGVAAAHEVVASGNGIDEVSVAYTVVHPVGPGNYTVSQDGGSVTLNPTTWIHAMNELTATFVPTGGIT
jgi:hypothetical protein